MREILEYDPDLLDVMNGNGMEMFLLASTNTTQDFLDEGGFMDIYVKEEEKWDVFLDQLSSTKKLSKDEKKLIKRGNPGLKREKTLLIVLISAIAISFLFTLGSIFKETLWEPDYVPVDEFERKIQQLQEQYIQENRRLQTQLEQAEHALDSLTK